MTSIDGAQAPGNIVPFDRRKVKPRACVVDSRRHIRNCLREVLKEAGSSPANV